MPPDPAKIAEEMDYLRGAGNDELLQRYAQAQAGFPLTAEKIARMLRKLREHGFTTAIEA